MSSPPQPTERPVSSLGVRKKATPRAMPALDASRYGARSSDPTVIRSQLVRRNLAGEAGDHQHAEPVYARRRRDHVVQARREQRHPVLAEALLRVPVGRRIIGLEVDPAVENEIDLVERGMVVRDGRLDIETD